MGAIVEDDKGISEGEVVEDGEGTKELEEEEKGENQRRKSWRVGFVWFFFSEVILFKNFFAILSNKW